ncbi:hypothetical protein B0H13DRAFT_2084490 [Mycena leptocephala]|nr:hypothetical protein B0H13DRAFT_2084490 [Mycena leptocephala]
MTPAEISGRRIRTTLTRYPRLARKSTHGASVITSEEKRKLEENSEVVDTLEDIFGLTCVARPYPCHSLCFVVLYSGRKTGPHAKISLRRKNLGASEGQCTEFGCTPAYLRVTATRSTILTGWMMTNLASFSTSVRLCSVNDFQLYAVVRFLRDEEHDNREFVL